MEPAPLSRRGFEHGGIDRVEFGGPSTLWRRLGLDGEDHIGLCKDVQGRFEAVMRGRMFLKWISCRWICSVGIVWFKNTTKYCI
jgi:hypothetical protein